MPDSILFWEMSSQTYDDRIDGAIGRGLRPAGMKFLSGEKTLGRALEMGCGTGYFTGALAQAANTVIATDLSDEMLKRAKERLKNYRNVTFQKEDCKKTSFPEESFDTVFIAQVLEHISDPARALAEARRVLKAGGALIVVNVDKSYVEEKSKALCDFRLENAYGDAQLKHPQAFRYLSREDLMGMLEKSGFKVERNETITDNSEPGNCSMEYVRAVKTSDNVAMVKSIMMDHGSSENVIDVKYLVKNYGHFTAVAGVSFNVRKGEVFALLGPNGAGKTTIVEILELLKTPTRGYIKILGSEVLTGIPAGNLFMNQDRDFGGLKEKIGVLPQGFNSFELLTVYENIDYFARMYAKHMDADRLIVDLGLKEKRNALFKDLSGGLKQRVGIAIALINDPEIIFLDEPTTGLDPRSRRDVWEAIRALKAKGKTIFLTTHYMDEAYHLADRICVIHKGSIVAEGSPEDLINRYGGGNTLVIRECSAGALDPLLKAIPEGKAGGNNVLAKLREGDGMASIAKAVEVIKAGNFNCAEIYVKKPTLEDVFLNLTGEKLTESQPRYGNDRE